VVIIQPVADSGSADLTRQAVAASGTSPRPIEGRTALSIEGIWRIACRLWPDVTEVQMSRQLHQGAFDGAYLSRFEDAYTAGQDRSPISVIDCAVSAGHRTGQPTAARAQTGLAAAASGRDAHAPLQDGDPVRIGRYRLTARLGSGGMGVVYLGLAEDGRLVAVKVLRPELADDPEFRARFGREVAVLAQARGTRIVRVIEVGTDSGTPFLVTEYAAGPSLADHVDSAGPLGAQMLGELAAGLAEALMVIHAAGVVHRDLKPANVILAADGPKVIDFGIAQALDSVALTQAGMTVGSVGFMAPEQVMGQAGPAADIFAWALTVAYAATGRPPFGTGATDAVMYRILHGQPDIAAVPEALRPVVEAALAKAPQDRPAAHEILDQLTGARAVPAPTCGGGAPTQPVPSPTRPVTALSAGQPGQQEKAQDESHVREAPAPGAGRSAVRRALASRRAVAVPALVVMVTAALALALMAGGGPRAGRAGSRGTSSSGPLAAGPFGLYPGQQHRGVFQTISRIVAAGRTIVTTGAQVSGGITRQQFFASADGGRTWHLAPVRAPGGGQPPLGYQATRLAASPRGWMAIGTAGPQAIWTSKDGLSWTLVATHGIAPQLPGDQVFVLTGTTDGFLAAGQGTAPGGQTQAVIWTSPDGLTWQRMTAAQLGLAGAQSISYATANGRDTVISGALGNGASGTWLSTDGGSAWMPVTIPADHGAQNTITGLAFDSSGLIAVRPGTAAGGVAYFSPDGRSWQYAATIGAATGFNPQVVKGSNYGFVVTGIGPAGNYVAYTSTGDGAAWRPTGSLGTTASYASTPAATVAPGGIIIAAGSTAASKLSQQAVLLQATPAGRVRPVPLASLPGAVIPPVTVTSLATAGSQQVAVGSADGYPAIWHRTPGHPWALVSPLALVAGPRLAGLTSVTHGPAGWLAVGLPGPVAFTSADGTTWQPARGSIAHDLAGVAGVAAAAGPAGYVIVGKLVAPGGGCVADVWWSPDLARWTRAHDVNEADGSSQVLAVAAQAHGFVSAGSHNGQPAVWTTTSGPTWTTMVLPLSHGATGVLQQVAVHGRRVAALGVQTLGGVTRPLAELSADGGATWRQIPFGAPGPDAAITALTADDDGFTAAVRSGTPGQQDVTIWTSAGGARWTQSHVSGVSGTGTRQLTTLASSGATVTGIDSIDTPLSQRLVIMTISVH
jgi:hypothetical protein